jgi:hypothetical protein
MLTQCVARQMLFAVNDSQQTRAVSQSATSDGPRHLANQSEVIWQLWCRQVDVDRVAQVRLHSRTVSTADELRWWSSDDFGGRYPGIVARGQRRRCRGRRRRKRQQQQVGDCPRKLHPVCRRFECQRVRYGHRESRHVWCVRLSISSMHE